MNNYLKTFRVKIKKSPELSSTQLDLFEQKEPEGYWIIIMAENKNAAMKKVEPERYNLTVMDVEEVQK